MSELKKRIQDVLASFASGNLSDNAKALLNVLGYESDRTVQLSPNNYRGFSELFQPSAGNFNPDKAKVQEWQSVDIIFQLTEDDIKKNHSFFEATKVDNAIIESYLFFAVALTGSSYARGDLVKITREINRLTPMPAMVFFRYGDCLTVAIIDRRLHKRESAKDVLEKVTLIKDINIANPHRAHIEILDDLALATVFQKHAVANFVALHKAWQKTLDTSELNKRFYRELANWYFWAVQHVEFPADVEEKRDVRNATGVIRLLTRLIFIWFIKEKGLVPHDVFNQTRLKQMLNYRDRSQSTYYKAILQNLFFATLNTEMNKDKPGSRKFRGRRQEGRDQHYMIHNVFRYADLFLKPNDALSEYFENIPFLNGGLFECLDKIIITNGKEKAVRIDGFSERHDNALKVPDNLFFAAEQPVDLNEVYGTKNKTYKVKGLIDILDSYKFTIDENTPVEEEIALDPELLGKVFENLLASYNPETQTTARKQTGSFYTPREIVNYMVDESLIACLPSKVAMADGDARIRHLLSYTEEPHQFADAEVDALIDAIDGLKILDPACGSGAFPMGILHKLAFILGKLDPHNDKWREKQRQKAIKETEEAYRIGEQEERQKRLLDIDDAFENNASDYGRKLYLIENCIFGVDIQPIAVQIAKLRFFVSLIVDQRIDSNKANLGVRPLPNLETKFVAANTLIGIQKPAQMSLRNPEIDKKEEELKKVRERHFTARTPQTKEKYRKEDERLRAEISELLKKDGFPSETTEKLAKWNPYDQNASADFFDPEWMFGIQCPSPLGGEGAGEGFDIVIGNPPYVRIQTMKESIVSEAKYYKDTYRSAQKGNYDIYVVFLENGLQLLNFNGKLAFILPHKFFNAQYGQPVRELLAKGNHVSQVVHFGEHQVFQGATNYTCLLFLEKTGVEWCRFTKVDDLDRWFASYEGNEGTIPASQITSTEWNFVVGQGSALFEKLGRMPQKLGDVADIFVGLQTSADDVFILDLIEERSKALRLMSKVLDSEWVFEKDLFFPIVSGTDVIRYVPLPERQYVLFPYKVNNASATLIDFKTITEKYPKTATYLKENKKRLEERERGKFKDSEWYRFGRNQNIGIQEQVKLCVPRLVDKLYAAYDMDGTHYLDNVDVGGITLKDAYHKQDLKYLLALLNSRLLVWYFPFVSAPFRGGWLSANRQFLSLLPIHIINFSAQLEIAQHEKIIRCVDQILAAKKKDPKADTSALEKQIDLMVYALYGLTPEEIAIVEGKR